MQRNKNTSPSPMFTPKQILVLKALRRSERGNGNDFGFIQDAYAELKSEMSKEAFAGVVGSIQPYIEWQEITETEEVYTQIALTEEVRVAVDAIETTKEAKPYAGDPGAEGYAAARKNGE